MPLIYKDYGPILTMAMNFRRPCWLTLYATFTMMGVGFGGFIYLPSLSDFQTAEGWRAFVGIAFYILIVLGTIGFVVAAVWCLLAAFLLWIRSRNLKS
jgi:hypothetical protein